MEYSEKIMEHFLSPLNRKALSDASGTGIVGVGGAGPFVVFQVLVKECQIEDAGFQCHNCGVAVAAGSMLTQMVIHTAAEQSLKITTEQLSDALDGVPIHKRHIAEYALRAMHLAIRDALK